MTYAMLHSSVVVVGSLQALHAYAWEVTRGNPGDYLPFGEEAQAADHIGLLATILPGGEENWPGNDGVIRL